MKTLTEKIIEALEFIKTESQGELIRESFNLGINKAIDIIKEIEKEDDFDAVSRQVIKYLAEFHHPHTTIIITSTNSELVEGVKNTGTVLNYIVD